MAATVTITPAARAELESVPLVIRNRIVDVFERLSKWPAVSGADKKAVVLRNGVEIGSAAVAIDGAVSGAWAYSLRDVDSSGAHWLRVPLSSESEPATPVLAEEWKRFHAPDAFRRAVATIVRPGTTVVVTSDSLMSGAVASPVTLIDAGAGPNN